MKDDSEYGLAYEVDRGALRTLVEEVVRETEGVHIKSRLMGKELRVKQHSEGIDIRLGLAVSRGMPIPSVVRELRDRLSAEFESTFESPLHHTHIIVREITKTPSI